MMKKFAVLPFAALAFAAACSDTDQNPLAAPLSSPSFAAGVQNVSASVSGTSVTISWQPIVGIENPEYMVVFTCTESNSDCGISAESNTRLTSVTRNNIPAGTYSAKVRAKDYTNCPFQDCNDFVEIGQGSFTIGTGGTGDTSAPVITYILNPAAPNGSNGWYKTGDVTLTWTVTENESPSSLSKTGCVDQTISQDQLEQTYSCSATSDGGSATRVDVRIKRDVTAPALGINGAASGDINVCSALPSRPSFSPSDATSGLDGTQDDSWSTPSNASGVGTYTYSAWAKDNAGNEASGGRTYVVKYGASVSAPLSPIKADGSSRFKLGSTIPVKFTISCDGVPVTNVVARLFVKQTDNVDTAGDAEVVSTAAATTGNLFRYSDGQYIFNLDTKAGYTNPDGSSLKFGTGSWTLTIMLDDRTHRNVSFQIAR